MTNTFEAEISKFVEKNKEKYPSGFFIERSVGELHATDKLIVLTRAQRIELAGIADRTVVVESVQESAGEHALVGETILNLYTNPRSELTYLADQLLNGERIRFLRVTDYPGWVAVSVEHDFPGQAPFEVGWMEEKNVKTFHSFAASPASHNLENLNDVVQGYLGTPYLLCGKTKNGIDCSGLSQQIIKRTKGIVIPRLARWQALVGEPVESEALRPGDLAFFTEEGETVSHAGVVVNHSDSSKPLIAHSSVRNGGVKMENLSKEGWLGNESNVKLVGYRRIIHS